MSEPQKPSILGNIDKHVAAEVAPLAPDEVARVGVAADQDSVTFGGAVDLGKGFSAGGHVEKTDSGWGWFVGGVKRWMKKK